MNKGKRGLELTSAIISIVMGSILALGSLVLLGSIDLLEEAAGGDLQGMEGILKASMVITLLLSVAIIILGSILCTSPIKNGKIKSRMGSSIALIVLLGLLALMELSSSFFYFLLFATPCGLLIASICMKHNKVLASFNAGTVSTATMMSTPTADEMFEKVILEPEQKTTTEQPVVENNTSVESIESQLLKLKELKDNGVIDEEQYKEAVGKLLNKL